MTGRINIAASVSLLPAKFTAVVLTCFVMIAGPAPSLAQTFPELLDRTSESLQGLANDTSYKSLELGDFNNDGIEDLLVVRRDADPVLLINESSVLTNRTDEYLPQTADAANSNYVEAFDANADGLTDLVFARLARSPLLYINRGGDPAGSWLGFASPVEIPAASDSLVIESGDINADGLADLFVIQVELATNKLLINNGNGEFVDESERLSELADLQRGHSALLADVEGDGDIDIIYIESDLFLHVYYNEDGRYSNSVRQTFQNSDKFAYIFGAADFNGDGIFDYRQYSNTAPMAQMSVGIIDGSRMPVYLQRQDAPMLRGNRKHGTVHMRDIDADGDIDYVLSSMLRNFGGLSNTYEGMRTEIVINKGYNSGEFETFTGPDWGRQESMDMKILDINSDGNMDLFVAHQNRYGVYLNGAPVQLVELQSLSGQAQQAGLATTFNAQLASGSGVQFEWDFGDGTIINTDQRSVTHVYAQPGRYLVSLTATSNQGSDQITYTQRVHEPLLDGTARSSSSIVIQTVEGASDRVWVANPDNNSVTVIEAQSGSVLAEIPVGSEPHSLAVASDDFVLVSNKASAELLAISTTTFATGARLQFQYGSMPHGVVVDREAGLAYLILEATGEFVKVKVPEASNPDFAVLAKLDVGPFPRHLSLSADGGNAYVSRFITRPVAGESSANVSTSGGGEVLAINTTLMQQWSTAVLVYNDVEDADDRARGIPNYLTAAAIAPHGSTAVVGAKLDNIYRGTLRDGNARQHNMLVRSMTATINLTEFRENLAERIDFDNNSPPTALAFGPAGNLLFVIHEASRQLEIIDVYRGETVYSADPGFAPKGLALSADGRQLYVHNYLSRSVSFFDTSQLIDGQSDNAIQVRTVATVSNEVLSPQVLEGKRLFHDAADPALTGQKYISCAVCHSEMGHDGRTWDFTDVGEGLRNTIDLRGRGGMAHGNIHWTANFNEIHDFENDIREVFKGSGLLTDEEYNRTSGILDEQNPKAGLSPRLDALSAFVSSLTQFPASPYRSETGASTASAQRGYQVFRRANCASCHSGQPFTDSPSGLFHNIGTVDSDTGNRLGMPLPGNGLDTPTLRGLWLTAPYLHDGSALTLQSAVRAHRRMPAYADTRRITGGEMDDLVAYLMQIDDTEPVASSNLDNDGDLVLNDFDDDDDNDGVADNLDALPFDASETTDNDGDGIGDNADPDDDNDGIPDELEGENTNSDSDDVINRFDLDSDNDTIPDVIEAGGASADRDKDGRIDTPDQLFLQLPDTDADGISDYLDLRSGRAGNDSDDFDISDSPFVNLDLNGDGAVDALDGAVDNNNDGADDRTLSRPLLDVGGGCALLSAPAASDPTLGLLVMILLIALQRRRTARQPG